MTRSGSLSIGIDPLSRWSNAWSAPPQKGLYAIAPDDRDRVLVSVDNVSGAGDQPYRFALVFTKNQEFLLPNGPEHDFRIHSESHEHGEAHEHRYTHEHRDSPNRDAHEHWYTHEDTDTHEHTDTNPRANLIKLIF